MSKRTKFGFDQVSDRSQLQTFLTRSCKFKVKPDADPVTTVNGSYIYEINDAHDELLIKFVPVLTTEIMNTEHNTLSIQSPILQYQLLIQDDWQKCVFQRAKLPTNYGMKQRSRIVYEPAKLRPDTYMSMVNKINKLLYEHGSNAVFNEFFDVGELVDRFYARYEQLRRKLASNITLPAFFQTEDIDKDRLDYTTTIMSRLMFTFFLQLPLRNERQILPSRFLQDQLWDQYKHQTEYPSFYHYLCHLWFDYFNSESPRSERDGIFAVVPYLNGGLFAKKKGIEIQGSRYIYPAIQITDQIWEDIFTLFDNYNWSVLESTEDEFVITPEFLGYIYEIGCNQHESGSYYTPNEITEYISKQTLIPYLMKQVQTATGRTYPDHTAVSDTDLPLLFQHLLQLRICDNACGSGAFLIAAERALVPLYEYCLARLASPPIDPSDRYEIKRQIISHNLYGIDEQPGSVEISKLRLWLSMISDIKTEHPEPLPNIGYNFLVGNSLLGFVQFPPQWNVWGDSMRIITLLKEIQEYKEKYRQTKSALNAKEYQDQIDENTQIIRTELNRLYFEQLHQNNLDAVTKRDLQPFHWGFEFWDIFYTVADKKLRFTGGFDLIIGNPPYINTRDLSTQPLGSLKKTLYKGEYNAAHKGYDLCVLFIERSYYLLRSSGVLGYIISNKFLVTDYGERIRRFILDRCSILELTDVSEFRIFKRAGVYPIIMFIAKDLATSIMRIIANIPTYEHFLRGVFTPQHIPKQTFQRLYGAIFPLHLNETNAPIIDQISQKGRILPSSRMECGITGFEYTKVGNLIVDRHANGWQFIVSGNITPFQIMWGIPVTYFSTKWEHPYLQRSDKITEGKQHLYTLHPKVVLRGMATRLTAGVDMTGYAIGTSTYAVIPQTDDPYYLSGLYNSDLMNFFYNTLYKAKHLQGGFIAYNEGQLLAIPIIPYDAQNELHQRIRQLAQALATTHDPVLCDQLNAAVYDLYDISENQQRIIQHEN